MLDIDKNGGLWYIVGDGDIHFPGRADIDPLHCIVAAKAEAHIAIGPIML